MIQPHTLYPDTCLPDSLLFHILKMGPRKGGNQTSYQSGDGKIPLHSPGLGTPWLKQSLQVLLLEIFCPPDTLMQDQWIIYPKMDAIFALQEFDA